MRPLDLRVVTHRSPLGDWEMTLAEPGPPLAGLVSVLWDVHGETHYSRESILPSGGVEILFSLGAEQRLLDSHDYSRFTSYRRVWVSGLQERHLVVEAHGHSHLIGLRLTPLGAWRFFSLPLHELAGQVLDLDLVLGRSLLQLHEQLGELPEAGKRLRRLAGFVARRIAGGAAVHPAVAHCLDQLSDSHGRTSVNQLLETTGYSRKHLVRIFNEQVGLSPKRYASVLRFQYALERLQNDRVPHLSALAQDCGYYDQAHFNRDFRRFAGATPLDFLRRRLPDEVAVSMQT